VAPKKKGRIVGIGSDSRCRATSSYTSRRDEETAQMKAQMDSQKAQMDSQQVLTNIFRRKRNESFTTKPPLRRTFNNETSFDVNSS
uniref:Uncharacterized protein n=1 Tax=Brassica oleracea var. oleracea TaxID=109376 RepID=A0A0D3BTG7_BRAOL